MHVDGAEDSSLHGGKDQHPLPVRVPGRRCDDLVAVDDLIELHPEVSLEDLGFEFGYGLQLWASAARLRGLDEPGDPPAPTERHHVVKILPYRSCVKSSGLRVLG